MSRDTEEEMPSPQEKAANLEKRLHDGWGRIDAGQAAGLDVTNWENFWLRLLAEYEQICRELTKGE